jgi:hypothetical protein
MSDGLNTGHLFIVGMDSFYGAHTDWPAHGRKVREASQSSQRLVGISR